LARPDGRTNGTENRRMDGDDDPATDARAKARERLRQRRLNRGRAESRAGSAAPVGSTTPPPMRGGGGGATPVPHHLALMDTPLPHASRYGIAPPEQYEYTHGPPVLGAGAQHHQHAAATVGEGVLQQAGLDGRVLQDFLLSMKEMNAIAARAAEAADQCASATTAAITAADRTAQQQAVVAQTAQQAEADAELSRRLHEVEQENRQLQERSRQAAGDLKELTLLRAQVIGGAVCLPARMACMHACMYAAPCPPARRHTRLVQRQRRRGVGWGAEFTDGTLTPLAERSHVACKPTSHVRRGDGRVDGGGCSLRGAESGRGRGA
jgi:hypothetical protein